MLIAFELSMPSNSSWNGKWSGDEQVFAIIKSFRKPSPDILKLIESGRHYYNFGDGWCACVAVSEVDRGRAAKLRKASRGFAGYDWMVDSLLLHGDIRVEKRPVPTCV